MRAAAGWVMVVACLAGCAPKTVAVDPCAVPALSPKLPAGTYAGEHERMTLCLKTAVRVADRSGGPVEAAAHSAIAACQAQHDREIDALARQEPVYAWEKAQMRETLAHAALLYARQVREHGCGRTDGRTSES